MHMEYRSSVVSREKRNQSTRMVFDCHGVLTGVRSVSATQRVRFPVVFGSQLFRLLDVASDIDDLLQMQWSDM